MIAHISDRRRCSRNLKKRVDRLRSRRADSRADVLLLMRELLERHMVRHHMLLLLEGMAHGQTVRDAGGRKVRWLGVVASELVAALDGWRLTRTALVRLCSGLLGSLSWRTAGSSRDVQELAIAVEGHWSIWVRMLVLLVMVQEDAIWRLRDRAAMKVLVLQMQWEGWSAERLFDGSEVRSCWDTVDVRRIVVGGEVRRQSWIEVSRRRSGVAEVLRIDTTLIRGTEAVVEVFQSCEICFVALCIVDIERTGEARVSKRRISNLTGHLGNRRKTRCNVEAV